MSIKRVRTKASNSFQTSASRTTKSDKTQPPIMATELTGASPYYGRTMRIIHAYAHIIVFIVSNTAGWTALTCDNSSKRTRLPEATTHLPQLQGLKPVCSADIEYMRGTMAYRSTASPRARERVAEDGTRCVAVLVGVRTFCVKSSAGYCTLDLG